MIFKITRVSPSIIAINYKDEEELKKNLMLIEKGGADFVHLDIMDGKFVPTKNFEEEMISKIREFSNLLIDVHLMVQNPEEHIEKYIKAGADLISFHYEATDKCREILELLKRKNVLAGLAINPKTPAYKIKEFLKDDLCDVVLVMSVNPGKYGQEFIPGSAEKVAEIRDMNKNVLIEVDGGVNVKNSKVLRKLGANILVSGKTIFYSKNVKKTVRELKGKDYSTLLKFFANGKKDK